MIKSRHLATGAALLPVLLLLATGAALAATGAGKTPWDTPLQDLQAVLEGPTAKAISIIAIVIAGAALVFGEDLGQFTRRLLLIVLAVALILGAGSLITGLEFSQTSGALI